MEKKNTSIEEKAIAKIINGLEDNPLLDYIELLEKSQEISKKGNIFLISSSDKSKYISSVLLYKFLLSEQDAKSLKVFDLSKEADENKNILESCANSIGESFSFVSEPFNGKKQSAKDFVEEKKLETLVKKEKGNVIILTDITKTHLLETAMANICNSILISRYSNSSIDECALLRDELATKTFEQEKVVGMFFIDCPQKGFLNWIKRHL